MTSQDCVYEGRDYKQGDFFQSLSFCCSDVSGLCVWGQRLQAWKLLPVSTVSVALMSQDCVYEGRDYKHGNFFQSLQFLLHWCLKIVCMRAETTSMETSSSLYSFCCSDVSRLCVWGQRLQAGRLLPISKFLLQWCLRTVCMRAETTSRETSSSLYSFCCIDVSGLCMRAETTSRETSSSL